MIVRRLAGLAFFVTVIAFIGFTTLVYTKAFRSVVMVDLVSDSVGNALPADADVKIRGVIVGEVRSATPENGRVVSRIALDEASAPMIPANVTARLLPKTLFGERYVALQIPDGARDRPIAEGDVIEQDVSGNAIEVGQLLDSVLPLLDAVPPDKLASTLGALAQALDGRGEMLGTTIDRLETVFAGLNSELPTLRTDLVEFATLTETYSTAAPDLIDALDNLSVTGSTLVEKRPAVDTLLTSAIATSGSTADLLDANRDSIITLASGSRETLELLAEFSPTLGCTLTSFAALLPEANRILGAGDAYPGARGTIRFVNPRGAYLPNQDEPRLIDDRGAACYDDVTAPGTFFPQYPGSGLNDGSYQVPSRNPGPANVRFEADPLQSPVPADATLGLPVGSYAGSDIERTTLAVVYGQGSGIDPGTVPAWTTLVGAPALRGSEVTVN